MRRVTCFTWYTVKQNETKSFTFRLVHSGFKTCFVVDYGDGSAPTLFGSFESCKIRCINSHILPII